MCQTISSNLGYPRIGENREWKKILEGFWSGKQGEDTFHKEIQQLRLNHLQKQKDQGIDLIPVGDFSLYDHVLDTSVMFGIIPERFKRDKEEDVSLQDYFAIARGSQKAVASAMTKWFNTNYHYIVPELQNATPRLTNNRPLSYYREAKEKLNINGKPVLLGPITFLKLAKGYEEERFDELLDQFLPLYETILQELEEEGAEWVQIDEPVLVTSINQEDIQRFQYAYQRLNTATPQLNILLQTYFESVEHYEDVIHLPVQGIGLDFVFDEGENLESLRKSGFPEDKVLAAGVVDGRNVWRANLKEKFTLIKSIDKIVPKERLIIQPSSSLLHVPVTVKNEPNLDPVLRDALAFADEKLLEVHALTKGLNVGVHAVEDVMNESAAKIEKLNQSPSRNVKKVQHAIKNLASYRSERQSAFQERQTLQQQRFNLPVLPTTSIGSLPQTSEDRKARQRWRKGEWDNEQYDQYIKDRITKWIDIQESIGLDVLIHGEFERNDMVEYFGEKLGGFATTQNAWVQSYGSRCVKPPLVYGDVHLIKPMTVKESIYAQSLTDKPIKGMLTGPVTILNWSFVSDHVERKDVLHQVALALRQEVETLEENHIQMIQVDEPALREGLPLKRSKWDDYLNTAVHAFKLATSSVQDETQIHTHMCYSEFQDIIDAINDLDADVISIEAARSHGELITTFEKKGYDKGIGLGVYDIHSPRIPEEEEMIHTINRALQALDPKLFWINPDCGLKTRKEEETASALTVMVQAAHHVRNQLTVQK